MRRSLKDQLRQLYDFRCGYCGVSESDVGAELTVDHFHPTAHGGSDTLSNLVYCCSACNSYKGEFWAPDSEQRLLHPREDDLSPHVTQTETYQMRGLTATGRFHIEQLHLNRAPLIAYRRRQVENHLLRQEVLDMRERQERLAEEIEQLWHLLEEQSPMQET
jgi:hypothetical protein